MSRLIPSETQLPDPIPSDLTEEFLKRTPYVCEGLQNIRVEPGGTRVTFDLLDAFEPQKQLIAERLADVAAKLCMNYRPGILRTIVNRELPATGYREDPHPSLLEHGDLTFYGRGRFGLGPKIVRLIEYFDARARKMAQCLGADPYTFPSLIGADVLDTCRYLNNFPASLNLVTHLREDHGLLQEFTRSVKWDGDKLSYNRDAASPVECLLSPSVCFHWYRWLRDSDIKGPRPITALGKCFRYESSNLVGLERLWDFTMREIVFVGAVDFVIKGRNALLDLSTAYLDHLNISYEIRTATDPFFVDSYAVQAAYQQGFELKFEMLATLPYSGKQLAVGSINYHQDFFGRSFRIQAEGVPAHTACLGFGYERLALAFIAQHGPEQSAWPNSVVEGLRTLDC